MLFYLNVLVNIYLRVGGWWWIVVNYLAMALRDKLHKKLHSVKAPLTPSGHLQLLLCLTPDDFNRQCRLLLSGVKGLRDPTVNDTNLRKKNDCALYIRLGQFTIIMIKNQN